MGTVASHFELWLFADFPRDYEINKIPEFILIEYEPKTYVILNVRQETETRMKMFQFRTVLFV